MTLHVFLIENKITVNDTVKSRIGELIAVKARSEKIQFTKVKIDDGKYKTNVNDYPDDWLNDNAPDIIIDILQKLNEDTKA